MECRAYTARDNKYHKNMSHRKNRTRSTVAQHLLAYSYSDVLKRFQLLSYEPMLRVKDPATFDNPPRKLASMFWPASGHFSVQNFASSDVVIGAVNVNTTSGGIDVSRLTSKFGKNF